MNNHLLAWLLTVFLSAAARAEPVASDEPLQGYVELSPTAQFIKVALNAGTPQAKHFIVQDGRMNTLSTDRSRIVFIAKLEQQTKSLRYHPVEPLWIEREGKRVQLLHVAPPLTADSSKEELARAGLTSLELSLTERPTPSR